MKKMINDWCAVISRQSKLENCKCLADENRVALASAMWESGAWL